MEIKMENNKQNDSLDFSGLFKLDILLHFDISIYSFYEIGLKKLFTCTDGKELIFLYIDSQSERYEKKYEWDFVDNPINCFCFEPSGTWLLIVSEQKVLLVPYLPLFSPQNHFDCKWSLSSVTVLPFGEILKPTSVLWWLTKESENVIIIGTKSGSVVFYSLESQSIVGECKVAGEISDLQMCFDDSLDLLALLVTSSKSQQWKLVLEHRSVNYNWLNQIRTQTDKKEGFMSYIKQLSRDKINMLTQGGSKDNNVAPADYTLKPTDYLPSFRKGSNNWSLTAQYVNGRHFLTAFELNEGTLILEVPDTDTKGPSRTLKPRISSDGLYIQGLWSQRLIYLLRKNEIEVHSVTFSTVQGDGEYAKSETTKLWSGELIGDVLRGHVMSAREAATPALGWREPTFMCDLQLPRFTLQSCLVVTRSGAYVLNTIVEPCEWVVSLVMRGGVGAERAASALAADTPALMRASADMLMSRGKIAAAQFLYSLSKSSIEGWVARLGVFGRLHELALYRHTDNVPLTGAPVCIRTLALLLKMATNPEQKFDMGVNITILSREELTEVSQFIAGIGLWELLPTFTLHQGYPELILDAMRTKSKLCRGALTCLLMHRNIVTALLEENGKWFLDFLIENCKTFDWTLLKCFGIWMNPLQDQFRPVMRDLRQGINTPYTTRMLHLITAFTYVLCAIESINPSADIEMNRPQDGKEEGGTWKDQFVSQRTLSCGLGHWAVTDEGNAKIMMTHTPINTGLIGRVISVACGRHHTIVLTENGVYASGDNSFGQLGVGRAWGGGRGEGASCAGALQHVTPSVTWPAPVRQVAAGHYHSAAIDAGGRLYTWGWNVHGQLGLGSICDQPSPQLVTRLQGRKVESVGCGAAHTVVGMKNGEVWACGASVFGQLGSGGREKSSVFIRVPLPDPVHTIAVGYFHNLALSQKGVVYEWGASPQMIRAWCPRTALSPPPPPTLNPSPDPHLAPRLTDLANVPGRILKISAGWHHSALIDSYGTLFTWGLNFDGQLGSGDRKSVLIPTEAKILSERPSDNKEDKSKCKVEFDSKSLVACGGDFTIYIDDDGRVYGTGNLRQSINKPITEREKTISRVLMLKTTKRVVKIPAGRGGNKFMFQQIDRMDIMFPFDIDDAHRTSLSAIHNPLKTMKDYRSNTWLDHIIQQLKPWMDETILENTNIKAKLAFYNNKYVECFKLCLESISFNAAQNEFYLVHSKLESEDKDCRNDLKIELTNIMSKRIKDISFSILNEDPYPPVDEAIYKRIPCCCDEPKYLPGKNIGAYKNTEKNSSVFTANVIDKCMNIFPVEANIWESCFRLAKDYYVENGLDIEELQKVFDKYLNRDVTCMAHAVLYSNDCAHFNQILSPEFYLDMCNRVLDTWV